MNPIPKRHALEACKTCTKRVIDKCCIYVDIKDSKGDIHNPPECLIFQFNQIFKGKHPPPIVSDGKLNTEKKDRKLTTKKIQEAQAQTVAHCYQKDSGSAGSNGSTFTKNGSILLPNKTENGSKSGTLKEGKLPSLTKTEIDILQLISKGTTTRKRLASAHKSGAKCVDKYLTKLRKKGYIDKNNQVVASIEGTLLPLLPSAEGASLKECLKEHPVRVHAQQWRIGILWKDEKYRKNVGTTSYDDGNVIYCGRDAIEIYSIQSFIANKVDEAMKKSMDYWTLFFHRLEHDYNIKLVKNRLQNIKLVKWEWAEVGNELATHCEVTGEKIRVEATEDGKVWLEMDNSFNLRECETKHPQTAKDDMRDVVVPFFNDMRDNKPPKLSDLMKVITHLAESTDKQAEINKETASGLNAVVTYLKSQLPKEPGESDDKENQNKDKETGMYG